MLLIINLAAGATTVAADRALYICKWNNEVEELHTDHQKSRLPSSFYVVKIFPTLTVK